MSSTLLTSDFEEIVANAIRKYQVLTLDDAINKMSTGINQNSIVFTFDDGYQDTYTEALPILEKYQVPATIYITSGFISREKYPYEFLLADVISEKKQLTYDIAGKKYTENTESNLEKITIYNKLKDKLRPISDHIRQPVIDSLCDDNVQSFIETDLFMNWDQVKKLNRHPLITIGAHTYSHSQLDLFQEQDVNQDIQKGTHDIEHNLDMKVSHFAYPYGGYDDASINLVKKNGFKSAVTTKPDYISKGKVKNILKLPRVELAHENIDSELNKLQAMFSI